jgi:hypothetical protein
MVNYPLIVDMTREEIIGNNNNHDIITITNTNNKIIQHNTT